MHENRGPDTWDYQWFYTHLKNNGLTIVPSVNLVANIGFGKGATHTIKEDARFVLPAASMAFPLRHPTSLIPLRSLDRTAFKIFSPSILQRIWRKMNKGYQPASTLIFEARPLTRMAPAFLEQMRGVST